ncbi:MAG: hypothetical protein IPL83_01920 [Bdellovibrionales bacterium]|nr:hypothetical protein [Bdellovibrionales bacterium]
MDQIWQKIQDFRKLKKSLILEKTQIQERPNAMALAIMGTPLAKNIGATFIGANPFAVEVRQVSEWLLL